MAIGQAAYKAASLAIKFILINIQANYKIMHLN